MKAAATPPPQRKDSMQPCMKQKTKKNGGVEGEIEAGRLRPEEEGERKKKKRKENPVDESLRGEECGVVRLPACRGTFS